MRNKVYPNPDQVRRQSKMACMAIHELANMGILVLFIKFRKSNPKIRVAHCPGTGKIKSMHSGQGINNQGERYLRRSSVMCGCEIEWQEVVND